MLSLFPLHWGPFLDFHLMLLFLLLTTYRREYFCRYIQMFGVPNWGYICRILISILWFSFLLLFRMVSFILNSSFNIFFHFLRLAVICLLFHTLNFYILTIRAHLIKSWGGHREGQGSSPSWTKNVKKIKSNVTYKIKIHGQKFFIFYGKWPLWVH